MKKVISYIFWAVLIKITFMVATSCAISSPIIGSKKTVNNTYIINGTDTTMVPGEGGAYMTE